MSLTSVDLPEPDTPVTATKRPERERHVDVAQVVLPGADDGELARPGSRGRRTAGTGIYRRPERYCPVSESRCSSSSLTVPECDHLAAVLAGARADVDDPVGRA